MYLMFQTENIISYMGIIIMIMYIITGSQVQENIRKRFISIVFLMLGELIMYSVEIHSFDLQWSEKTKIIISVLGAAARTITAYLVLCIYLRDKINIKIKLIYAFPLLTNIIILVPVFCNSNMVGFSVNFGYYVGIQSIYANIVHELYLIMLGTVALTEIIKNKKTGRKEQESLIVLLVSILGIAAAIIEVAGISRNILRPVMIINIALYYSYFQGEYYKEKMNRDIREREDILSGAETGMWVIEFEKGKKPKMEADSTTKYLIGEMKNVSGEYLYEFWHKNIAEEDRAVINDILDDPAKNYRRIFQYVYIHPDLGKIYIRGGSIVDRKYKKGVKIKGYNQNITDYVLAEKEQTELLRTVGSNYLSISYYIDLKRNKCRRFSDYIETELIYKEVKNAGQAMEMVCRYAVEDKDLDDMLRFTSLDDLSYRLRENNSIFNDYMSKRQGWCRAYFMVARRDENGNAERVLFIIQKIDEQRRRELGAQEALKSAYEAANRANEAKTEFLSQMSHDIRTPLNGMLGATTVAMANIDDKEKVRDSLEKISVSGKILQGLINEIFDVSKNESGKTALAMEPVNLLELLNEIKLVLLPQMSIHKHTFSVCSLVDDNTVVMADAMKIRQIIMNIVGNSIKYTPDGGKIELKLYEETQQKDKYRCFVFEITDTGIGMSADTINHIYEPFFRSKDSHISSISGNGLGMTIVQNLVRMMNGNIQIESKEGKGTNIKISLLLLETNKKIENYQIRENFKINKNAAIRYKNKRALIAEDNIINSDILADFLKLWGISAEKADNGKMAADMFANSEEGYYDFILMDVQMPEMDGYEATYIIRSLPREDSKKIPIFAMTANAFADDIKKANNAGMNEHIAKPIEIEKLYEAIEKWVL